MENAFMIAATGSGCGKTTITCALLQAMKNRKLIAKSFKCGPDYIDPMFHKKVLGIESKNLDLFFSDRDEIRRLFYAENSSDISVVEGVMGLYDGINSSSNQGSSYDLACKLEIPVVLVVNAHGMGRSLLALIKGFQAMDEDNRIKAVILNQISPMFFETVRPLIENELGLTVLGYYPKLVEGTFESRYLGLKMPDEIEGIKDDIQRAAATIEKTVNIDKLLEISRIMRTDREVTEANVEVAIAADCAKTDIEADAGDYEAKASCVSVDSACEISRVRIGVARDEAFCFFYEENLKLLKSMGAELVEFSPISDNVIPDNIDGLLLGGGYPELHAGRLSANVSMLESIKTAIDAGMPSLAECGGFMYLHDSIEVEGISYPMVGVLEGNCAKKEKLIRFGYLTIEEKDGHFLKQDNRSIKGHEFHYYDSSNNGSDAVSVKPFSNRSWEAAHITDNHWWGFAHLYYPSNRAFAKAFVDKCLIWREQR